jgi:uncharacterized protein YkwD
MRRFFLPTVTALLLGGCTAADIAAIKQTVGLAEPAPFAAPIVPSPPPPDPKTQMVALETRIAVLVEEQRIRIDPKAHPLAIDPELTKIARERASDMATKDYLAHSAPNGDTSATLLMGEDAQYQGLLGENLAAQYYVAQSGVDPDAFAQRFVQTWMDSAPHRENLSFADYDRTGVGAAVNGNTVYVAQLFSTPVKPGKGSSTVTSFDSPNAAQNATPPPADPLGLRGAEGSRPH